MSGGLTQRVRACMSGFAKQKIFTAPAVAEMIGEPDSSMIRRVFANLLRRGEIIKRSRGRYSYKGKKELWKRANPVSVRVFRAMHVSRAFSASDIAQEAGLEM
jgi:hypothetical protein